MKPETRLQSFVFQLTPTRTRCDLVITANGNPEKIASGLLEPFLSHLKTARDQISKGGYSIILEPDGGSNAPWFTKGTVERFVRFVSTPEVLERVSTIESEMLQIDEAISIQSNDSLGLSTVEDSHLKYKESTEGSKPSINADSDKAIVLFKPGIPPHESNGSTVAEENSKVQLLRVLETRKTMLQKEQGMAFARAAAAGFDMDHMAQLLSFSEFFGASRLMEACIKFMELWKRKHETGQWLEIEAAEIMSSRSDFSPMNTSSVVFPGEMRSHEEPWSESNIEMGVDGNGKDSDDAGGNISSQHLSADQNSGGRPLTDSQASLAPHEYIQGHFQPHMYPQWPIPSPSGAPVFSGYPVQGMPYYQNYQAGGQYFQPPYPPMQDPRFNGSHRIKQKKHSMDSKDSNVESETWEASGSNGRSQDSTDQSLSEKEVARGQEREKKNGRFGTSKSGVIMIRNINYITSRRNNSSGNESKSGSECGSDEEVDELESGSIEKKRKNKSKYSKLTSTKAIDDWNNNDRNDVTDGQDAHNNNWEAFQNFLLRDDDDERTNFDDRGMFSSEKEVPRRRHQNTIGSDPILNQQDLGNGVDTGRSEFDVISGKESQTYKLRASGDEFTISRDSLNSYGGRVSRDSQLDMQLTEVRSGRGYRKGTGDAFMVYGQGNQPVTKSILDPLSGNEFERADRFDKSSSQIVTDESFLVPLRSVSQDQVESERSPAIDIDSEIPSSVQKNNDDSLNKIGYEPNDLSLMPERDTERDFTVYDPAIDYQMEIHDSIVQDNGNQEDVSTKAKEGMKKSDKEKKPTLHDAVEKRKMEAAMKKGKLSKSNPSAEAHIRAEKLRAFKADLQKLKREKEEEEIKRLEALKRERQKRIAARGSSVPAQSPSSSQSKSGFPTKVSPSSHKGSKFSDSEPASSSPLQRVAAKVSSMGSVDSQKTNKPGRLNAGRLAGNGLSRSVSSLPELKKDDEPEPKAISNRTRRLSDPKGSSIYGSTQKSQASDPVLKAKVPCEPEMKKISAIMTLDRTKSATLPELKIKTSWSNSNITQSKPATKEVKQKGVGNKSSTSSETIKLKKSNDKTPHPSNGDENPVIEKTVVLEHDVSSVPVAHTLEETKQDAKETSIDGTTDRIAEFAAIHAPPSPLIISEVDKPSEFQFDVHPSVSEVTNVSDELSKSLGISASGKNYQAPFARLSSLEDPFTGNLEHSVAAPVTMEAVKAPEAAKALISDSTDDNSLEYVPELMGKPPGKDTSKGFRRLLKFGRKNHSSATSERSMNSDKFSVDGSVVDDHNASSNSSNEVHTLQNLISQDDSPVTGASHKVSRPFSLLSPFRSKNSEKKLTT